MLRASSELGSQGFSPCPALHWHAIGDRWQGAGLHKSLMQVHRPIIASCQDRQNDLQVFSAKSAYVFC